MTIIHRKRRDSIVLGAVLCDLRNGKPYLYHFHNFENVVVLDAKRELAKGAHSRSLAELFPTTFAAEDSLAILAAGESPRRG